MPRSKATAGGLPRAVGQVVGSHSTRASLLRAHRTVGGLAVSSQRDAIFAISLQNNIILAKTRSRAPTRTVHPLLPYLLTATWAHSAICHPWTPTEEVVTLMHVHVSKAPFRTRCSSGGLSMRTEKGVSKHGRLLSKAKPHGTGGAIIRRVVRPSVLILRALFRTSYVPHTVTIIAKFALSQ